MRKSMEVDIHWDDLTEAKQNEITHDFVMHGLGAPDEIDYSGDELCNTLGKITIQSI